LQGWQRVLIDAQAVLRDGISRLVNPQSTPLKDLVFRLVNLRLDESPAQGTTLLMFLFNPLMEKYKARLFQQTNTKLGHVGHQN
jgi:hypothetical protein